MINPRPFERGIFCKVVGLPRNKFGISLAYLYLWLRRRYSRSTIKTKNGFLFCIVLAYSYLCTQKSIQINKL